MNRPTITAVAVAALVWGCSGFATADEAPVCPPDLGIPEPIGVCGRDGNGPDIGHETTTSVLEDRVVDAPAPTPRAAAVPVSAPAAPVASTPTYTG